MNRSTEERPGSIKNERWLREFHNAVVKERRTGVDEPSGKRTSMKLGTTTFLKNPHTGEMGEWTYILPQHDPDTRKTVSMQNAENKYLDLIRRGKIAGYASVDEAEKDLHSFRKRIIDQTPKYGRGSRPVHKGGRLRWRGKGGLGHHSRKLSELSEPIAATEIK